jgi:hypothetical protein
MRFVARARAGHAWSFAEAELLAIEQAAQDDRRCAEFARQARPDPAQLTRDVYAD